MPRKSKLIRWERDDGKFRVVVYARNDRPTFRIDSGFKGDPVHIDAAKCEPEAVAVAEGIWQAYQRGAIDVPEEAPATVDVLIEKLCENPEHSKKTRRAYKAVWSLFAQQLGKRHPSRIYPLDVRTFLEGREAVTHNTYLRTLRATLNVAVTKGWIVENPTAGMKFRKESPKLQWLSREEQDTFLLYCTPSHRIRAAFVCETGLRAGELAAARWDWIHGEVGLKGIRVGPDARGAGFTTKRGRVRAVPLSKRALELLDEAKAMWPGHTGSDFIFSTAGLSSLTNLAAETREAVERARKAGNTIGTTDFHGLRRSCGAWWLQTGASIYEVSQLLGNDPAVCAKHYAGVTEKHLAGVVARSEPTGRPAVRRRAYRG